MVTLTLHDRDALAVLALINVTRQARQSREDANLDRAAAVLRCALLMCDCEMTSLKAP